MRALFFLKTGAIICFLLCFQLACFAQQWYPLSGGASGNVNHIEVDPLRNKIYVAGGFPNLDTLLQAIGVGQWDGTSWSRIGNTQIEVGGANKNVIKLINDTLLLGGFFNFPNMYMAMWPLSGPWQQHSPSSSFTGSTQNSLWYQGIADFCMYNNELYACGTFEKSNLATPNYTPTNNIAKWNGSYWEGVGNPPGVSKYAIIDWSHVEEMVEYNNELYIVGSFDSVGGVPAINIAKWNGTNWAGLGNGQTPPVIAPVGLHCATVYNGELYMGGGYFEIYKWNGSNWSVVTTTDHEVNDMCVYNGELIVTGLFDTIAGISCKGLARFNGQTWNTGFGSGFSYLGGSLYNGLCLNVLNNELYVGGYFDMVNGIPANYIARYGWLTGEAEIPAAPATLHLNPDAAFQNYSLNINSTKRQKALLQVTNCLGQTLQHLVLNLTPGSNHANLQLETLPAGIYIISLRLEDQMLSQKIFKR